MNCRHCGAELSLPFLDLGSAPPSNAYLTVDTLREPEQWFPLRVLVCEQCRLVQTEDFSRPETLFAADYAYFSSFSDTWLEHACLYVQSMIKRFSLGAGSKVVEIASNDGYLLQYVHQAGIPCLGIEPTAGTARAARDKGLEIIEDFFGAQLAQKLVDEGHAADLMTANNVLAHVPNINDFVRGFAILLKPQGAATFEFPHLLKLVQENQFDTIYHEHYSYLSLTTVQTIFTSQGLRIFDVERLPTHGGSLRVYAQRADLGKHQCSERVTNLLAEEKMAGMAGTDFYSGLQKKAEQIKNDLLLFLIDARRQGLSVAAYGAAAKGNTLLNFAGVRADLLQYVVDRNPAKQGKFMPGSRISIVDEAHLQQHRPDRVLILPWNLCDEIMLQLHYIREWGGQFVTAVPNLKIHQDKHKNI
ncbi:MAG: class I SAM-dependent methyltransferase [Proteobacteria bacterium]|nr:class I SAM-dependent methyltransferase [Pseudomonadota bacterium]MBU1649807.1 class I SAM-dependent methyltransferase [Pseudomonadota bacterium]